MGKKVRKELTKNEKERLDKFEKVSKELENKGYERHNLLTDAKTASTTGYLLPLPFIIIF